jgi:hypothetical protein
MITKEMRSAVMSALANDGVKKRHGKMTDKQKSRYYSRLRRGLDPKTGKTRNPLSTG